MMESDRSDKKTSLEEMSKDDVIKKYNNLLSIAKKAKQSKQELLEKLKKAEEKESKLTLEIDSLKEILESYTEKQKRFAEFENAVKQSNEKCMELKNLLQKVEGNLALKIIECSKMEEKIEMQKLKFSELEEKYKESLLKLEDFKESYAKVDIEKKICQEKLLLYEQEKIEKIDLNVQFKEIVTENKRMKELLNDNEKQFKEITEKYANICSQYTNLPENWNELVADNEKLKTHLIDAENTKAKLIREVASLGESVSEFKKNSQQTELILENLKKEEEKNFNLTSEINRLKEKVEELEKFLNVSEDEKKKIKCLLEECQTGYNQEIKFLMDKLEKERECSNLEKQSLEESLEKQKLEFENHMMTCQENSVQTFLLKEKTESGQKLAPAEEGTELEKSFDVDKILHAEKKKIENLINALREESDWEIKLMTERLEEKNNEGKTNLSETSASVSTFEKLIKNLEEAVKTTNEKFKDELGQQRESYSAIISEKNDLEKRLRETEERLRKMEGLKENLEIKINQLESEKTTFSSEKSNVRDKLLHVEESFDEKEANLSKKNLRLERLVEENQGLFGSDHSEIVEGLSVELNDAREALKRIGEKEFLREMEEDKEESHLLEENKFLKREIDKIKCNYDESVNLVRLKLEELLHSFTKVKSLRKSFDEEVKRKLKAFQLEQTEARENMEEIVLKYVGQLHSGNSELLAEMNDMNQVLKERGETISKLEELTERQRIELDEALTKMANQCTKLNEKNKKLEKMEEEVYKAKLEVETKHRAMREMEEEIWRMKNNDCQSEALSSSTISKAEDSARLLELEESFEEKYTKLKIIAVKLKKKVTDLQKQVETERNNLISAESDYQSKMAVLHSQVKSFGIVQAEYDKLLDVVDEEKKGKNSLKKNLESTQEELISVRQQLEEVKSEREKLKVDKNSFEKIKKELTVHIGELKQTVEKQKRECGQLERESEELKSQLSVRKRHLEEEREKYKAAILLLEEQKLDLKKHSVLELEMAAYEKTAEDLKKRLDGKEKLVERLENQLECERKANASLKDELNRLEENFSEERIKSVDREEQTKHMNEEMNGLKREIERKMETIKSLERSAEEKNIRIENLSLEIEEFTREKCKSEERFRCNEEKLCRQVHNLEEKISCLQDVLGQERMELDELKEEYRAYKVRAQSVLRQSQKEANPSKQQNALEELEQLKSASDSLKTRYEDTNRKLKKLLEENGSLREDKNQFFGRIQELNSALTELREENHKLKEAKQRENEEHAESMRMQKLQSETLAQCFQREMENLKSSHSTELEELKRELEKVQREGQVFFKADVKRIDVMEKRQISGCFVPLKPEKEIFDVMLIEREECEGSEIVDSTSPQQTATEPNNVVPLEQLLNQSESPDSKKSLRDATLKLERNLEKCENRIRHLTILLAEAENDSARLTQINDVLKEEIKRLQRSLDREKHAQNFEYLKNVIVKFASLQSGDERLRLVPVLNTILKLSPEEENVLTNCAKGITETGGRGWGINLGLWPTR